MYYALYWNMYYVFIFDGVFLIIKMLIFLEVSVKSSVKMLCWNLNVNRGTGSQVTVRQLPDFWPLGNPLFLAFIT